jgi:hypothetical protein
MRGDVLFAYIVLDTDRTCTSFGAVTDIILSEEGLFTKLLPKTQSQDL